MDATVLIIGAGTFGVSTAWHLSQHHRDPSQVTLLDRHASPPPRSAAADVNRVLTADYASPLYAGLAREALSFWAEDPDLEWYFHKVGRLVLREDSHPGAARGGGKEEEEVVGNRRGAGPRAVPACAEVVELAGVGRRWGVLDGTDTRGLQGAYLDPEAGWVDSATATWQFLETAVRRRVKREVGDVAELLVDRASRRIKGARTRDGRTFLAETVILAAGAWTSALLSPVEDALGIAEEDRIERQAQATAIISASYPVAGEELKRMAECKMPCIMYGQGGEVVPATRDNKTLRYTNLKTKIINTIVTSSGKRISAPPEERSQHDVPKRLKIEMEETLTKRLMPGFAKGRPKWRMCCTSKLCHSCMNAFSSKIKNSHLESRIDTPQGTIIHQQRTCFSADILTSGVYSS